jgi:hypothetical protein
MKKTIYLLNINNYSPEITKLTYPYINNWAEKIGAEVFVIKDRKFPEFPVVYEKLQIYELEQERKSDWIIYIDSDCLIHPDLFDLTELIPKDTVFQVGNDFVLNRISIDDYFRRDGRFIGTCNWFTIVSSWCVDFFKPIDDLSLEEMNKKMRTINSEKIAGIENGHLIDDFVLSRNLAKYGLKYTTMRDVLKKIGKENDNYFFHEFLIKEAGKAEIIKNRIAHWCI